MLSLIITLLSLFLGTLNPAHSLPGRPEAPVPASPPRTGAKFEGTMERIKRENPPGKPMGDIVQSIAGDFLGAAYEAGLLDRSEGEELFISLDRFDCVLFVETVLALARNAAGGRYQYRDLAAGITDLRYRGGKLDGYCSRLHYFSDWIADNQARGNVKDITRELGGIKLDKTLTFMSDNRRSYRQLKNNDLNYRCIKGVEANLKGRAIYYLPAERIKSVYPRLEPGDIIGVVTSIPGLDTTHTGFVYRRGNRTGLIHASPAGRVTVAPDLDRYIRNVDRAIGIFVVRPLGPD